MCGIFGFVRALDPSRDFTAPDAPTPIDDEARCQRGVAALLHRGPNGRGLLTVATTEARAILGHTRLAILDLSAAAAQPMVRGDGRYTLVFNGEVYNFRALRAELETLGAVFVSDGDTEVVLEALIRWGGDAVQRFVGMFALALWDRDTSTLTLARDRLGIKPLYVSTSPESVAFASEGQALLAAACVAPYDPSVPAPELAAWFHSAACVDPSTLLPGVESLLPGHILTWRPGTAARLRRFWAARPLAPTPPDPLAAVAAALDTAVKDCLISDVPLGIFLSGGVDSAAIAAVAARHIPSMLETFTLAFAERVYDESARAASIARYLGVRHHVATITPSEALAAVEPAFAAQDFPSHDGVNTWLVARAARARGLVVCLSGTGGDELFGGYRHFHELGRMLQPGSLLRGLPAHLRHRLLEGLPTHLPTRLRKVLALAGTAGEPATLARLVRQVFPESQARALLGAAAGLSHWTEPTRDTLDGLDHFGQLSVAELTGYLRNTQLRDIDAMSMAHGIEVRVPLLDHRLVALVLALKPSIKAPRAGLNKALLASAAGLPDALVRGPKMGFTLPWEVWLRGPLRAFAEDALLTPSPDPLRLDVVTALWRAFLERRTTVNATRILALVSLRLWYRRHNQALSAPGV